MRYTSVEPAGTEVEDGSWSIDDGFLTISAENEESSDGCEVTTRSQERIISAIVDDVFYISVIARTEGSGDSLDGTWKNVLDLTNEDERTCSGAPINSVSELSIRRTTTVNGDVFERSEEETGFDEIDGEREEYDESSTESGTVRIEGDRIYLTVTERDGVPLLNDEQQENLWAFRVSPSVAVMASLGHESSSDLGFLRQ